MPLLRLKATGQVEDIPDAGVMDALATGLYDPPGADVQIPVTLDGYTGQVSGAGLQSAADIGASPETEAGFRAREHAARIEREHGGVLGGAGAFIEQGLDAATLGGYGAVTDTIWGDDYTEDRRERAEANPVASGVGTAAGLIAPALLSGGTGTAGALARLTPAGAASRLGTRIAESGGGGLGRAALGYATEGAIYGAGHVLAESILKDKELSAEAFLAGAGEGAALGGLGGLGVSLFSRGARAAKRHVDALGANRAIAALEAEERVAMKEAQKAAKKAEKVKLDQQRHLNRLELERLRQQGREGLLEARAGAKQEEVAFTTEQKLKLEEYKQSSKKELAKLGADARLRVAQEQGTAKLGVAQAKAEAQVGAAEKRLATEVAKAEAQAALARARLNEASEALAVERAKYDTAKMVMDGRLQLSQTYTAGWRNAADSREAVAATKLGAAEVGADAKIRTGMADALVRSGREDAGYLIEELIPAKMRTPAAAESAKGEVLSRAAQITAATDDLVRQADEIMSLNPAAEVELRALRDRAAQTTPRVTEWSEKQAGSLRFQENNLDQLREAGFTVPSQPVPGLATAPSAPGQAHRVASTEPPLRFADGDGDRISEFEESIRSSYKLGEDDLEIVKDFHRNRQSYEINEKIRAGRELDDEQQAMVAGLDDVLAREESRLPQDVILSRGVRRGVAMPSPGDDLTDAAFMFTSLRSSDGGQKYSRRLPDVQDKPEIDRGFQLEIEAPAGTPALVLGGFESPVLLPRNLPLRVLEVNPETRLVRARVVGPDTPAMATTGDDAARTVPIEDIAERLIALPGEVPGRSEKIREALSSGKRMADLDPVDLHELPDGRLFVNDGRHRLKVAAETGEPIRARFSRAAEGAGEGAEPLLGPRQMSASKAASAAEQDGFTPIKADDIDAFVKEHPVKDTDRTRLAVDIYSGDSYEAIASYLRGRSGSGGDVVRSAAKFEGGPVGDGMALKEIVEELDAVVASGTAPRDIVLYRGVSGDHVPTFDVGDLISDPSYMSTSANIAHAEFFSMIGGRANKTRLDIEVPEGTPLGSFSRLATTPAEAEMVLPRQTALRVTHVAPPDQYGLTVVTARVERASFSPSPPRSELAEGMETLTAAESAQYELAQAIRPHLDDISGMSLDDAIREMDEAVTMQDEIVTDAVARQAEAAASAPPPASPAQVVAPAAPAVTVPTPHEPPPTVAPAAAALPTMPPMPGGEPGAIGRSAAPTANAVGVLDLAAAVGGLPNTNDIPVIGPLLGTYLKFRAIAGAMGRLGVKVGGPVAKIANTGASVQDKASAAIGAIVNGADKAAPALRSATPPLTNALARPLWNRDEIDEKPRASAPGTAEKKPSAQKLFEKRKEELLLVAEDPDGAREELAATIPAPPALAMAIAAAVVRKLEWLAGLLPKETAAPTIRPEPRPASPADMERLAIGIAATADPVGYVLGGVMVGAVSPLAVQALREVYPRLYTAMQAEVLEKVSTSTKDIPYNRKLNLAMVFDLPLDATLQPEYIAARQEEWAVAAQAAPTPQPGAQIKLSSQSELGAVRRATR